MFLAGLHFASEIKTKSKYRSMHNERITKRRNEHFSQKKDTGECCSTKLKSTCKNSGTFKGKNILPEKGTYISVAPSHSIEC